MKKSLLYMITLVLSISMLAAFSLCGCKTETLAAEGTKVLRIAYIVKVINPYFKVMIKGAEAEAEKQGVNLIVSATQQQTNVEEQVSIVQDMIVQKVDAICIAPIDSKALVDILREALDAGIPVVNVDNRLDKKTMENAGISIPYVGVDDEVSAYNAAKAIVEELGGKGKVAILEGIRGADNAQKRKSGAEKAFNEAPGIEIVASQTANWKAEEALTVFANILQANPDLNGVFCANDMMSFGAIQAIDAAGKTGEIVVTSIDAEDQALENIKQGLALATVYQNQDAQAAKAVGVAIKLINGNTVDENITVPTILVTKDDIK